MACQSVESSRPLLNWPGADPFSLSPKLIKSRFGFFSVTLYPDVTTATLISAFLMIIPVRSLSYFPLHMCLISSRGGLLWSHTCSGAVYRLFRQRRSPSVAIYIWGKLLWRVRTQSDEWKSSRSRFVSRYHDRDSSWWWSWFKRTLSWETCLL